jgi:hypothetical protein
MVDQARFHDAIASVSAYVASQFPGATTSDTRDHDRSAHTWIISTGDGPPLLLTVSFEFLSDTPPAEIRGKLTQWPVADTVRAAGSANRALVTRDGVTTTTR